MFQKAGVEMRHPFSRGQRKADEEGLGLEEGYGTICSCERFTLQTGREGGKRVPGDGQGCHLGLWAWGQGCEQRI